MVSRLTRDLRLAMAKDLLLYTNLKQPEIARRLGFNREGDFRDFFKREVHTTPIRWRAGHHLYNPNNTETTTRLLTMQCTPILVTRPPYHQDDIGTVYLAPHTVTTIETIDAVIVNHCIIKNVGLGKTSLAPSSHTHYRPDLRRIDTDCCRHAHRVSIAVSTRNSTIEVSAKSPELIESVTLDLTLRISSPVLPEGAVLWSSRIS